MDFSPYKFYDFGGVDTLTIDTFPFGELKGRLFSECSITDCCILAHLFPFHLPRLYEYLESVGCMKLNSLYYPPFILKFLNGNFLTVHEKTRILEELLYGDFTITPTARFLTYYENDHPNAGGLWSTSVSGFQSATPKNPRPDYLQFNSRYPHKYDVMGTRFAQNLPILFMFKNVLWKNDDGGKRMYGIPMNGKESIVLDDVEKVKVTDFGIYPTNEGMKFNTTKGTSFVVEDYLLVMIKSFEVVHKTK